jgi:flagellar biosynthetic protein FlhB
MAEIVIKVGFIFFSIAGFDYLYQRFEFEKNLRMTKQEVKDEYKMSEGDPQIKGRIKTIQRQIAYKRMMTDVPKADVVVTNPTHFAVALKYDTKKMSAPTVVAKGADLIALKIKEIAKTHGVPIVEDKPLAQALFKSVSIGDQIPEKLFQAVAQILAYIFKLKQAR